MKKFIQGEFLPVLGVAVMVTALFVMFSEYGKQLQEEEKNKQS
tara:strand:- start:135 stop:263 length:129 start_codon:yes stop_codon:yes gene_type:complete